MIFKLNEVRKEDNLYFKGAFWIVANNIDDILCDRYQLVGNKIPCSYEGKLDRARDTRTDETHETVWNQFKSKFNNVDYKYYPRGRVEVYKGKAYININSILNNPRIIDKIRKEYCIQDLDYHVGLNDIEQGSHYDFKLQ